MFFLKSLLKANLYFHWISILCKLHILSKPPILFSTVNLKLEHNFTQFIHRSNIWVLVLGCTSKFYLIHEDILGFLKVALEGIFDWSFTINEKEKIGVIEYKPSLYFQYFRKWLKGWEIGVLEVPLISYILLDCEQVRIVFQGHHCWLSDFGDSLQYIFSIDIKLSSTFSKKKIEENVVV